LKRAATYSLIAVLALALIGAGVLGAAWLAGTTDGARWLMDAVSRHTPLAISARTIEGRLLDRLQLGGVRLALTSVEVAIESIDIRWQPFLLLSGTVAAKEMTLTGVLIRDNTPMKTPPDLAWPIVSGVAGLFDAKIGRLQVNGLTYRRPDGQSVNVTAISSSAAWRNAVLSLSDLAAVAPTGRIAGSIAAGFSPPSLRFDLAATPAKPIAGMDALTLQARLLPGRNPEQLAGGFTVAGASGKVKRMELAGEVGMTRQAFNLRQLHLTRPGRRGMVTGEGTVTLTAREPFVELQIKAAGLDLTPEIKVAADLSGTLTLTGTPERYRGEFAMTSTGKGWRTARLAGAYEGDGTGMKLAPLTGALLAGSVQGSLDVDWREGFSLEGTIRGRDLNPAGISPDWAGVVNFDLTAACTGRR
jgi:translocation and assembly module TamB